MSSLPPHVLPPTSPSLPCLICFHRRSVPTPF
jgi:hypothetical protein